MANNLKQLDAAQVLRSAYDPNTNRLRTDASVSAVIGAVEVIVDHTNDSIRLGDGTSFLTSTTVGSDIGLDVNLINSSLTVSATDLDIRDLLHTQDSIRLGDGTNLTSVNASGELQIRDDDLNDSTDNIEEVHLGRTNTGTLTAAGQSVEIDATGLTTGVVTVTGTFTGILTVDGTIDNTNWTGLRIYDPASLTVQGVIVTSILNQLVEIGGFTKVRVYAAVLSSGSASINISGQMGDNITQVISPQPNSFLVGAYLRDDNGTGITLGQKTSASSLPVVLASDDEVDIRDLDHTSDSVSLGDGVNLIDSTTIGTDTIINVKKFEDPTFYTIVDQADALTTYTGKTYDLDAATSDEVWQIYREAKSGALTVKQYGNDDAGYIHAWDDRTSLFGPVPFSNGFSAQLDGANDYLSVPNNALLQFDYRSEAASFNMWIKTSDTSNVAYLGKLSSSQGYEINLSAGNLTFDVQATGLGQRLRVRTDPGDSVDDILQDGDWHMIAITYDGSGNANGVSMYIDGVSQNLDIQNNGLTNNPVSTNSLGIGASTNGSSSFGPGNIDEVSIWDVELSPSEVNTVYNAGIPTNLQGFGASPITQSLIAWWRMGDGPSDDPDNLTIVDVESGLVATMNNMTPGDIEGAVPG